MVEADALLVYLDPHNDHLTGAQFGVSAAGVQRDALIYNDNFLDPTGGRACLFVPPANPVEPAAAGIRTLHPPTLDRSRDKLFWFLCGWLGGPNHYIERFGHPMLRARHPSRSVASQVSNSFASGTDNPSRKSPCASAAAPTPDSAALMTADCMDSGGMK